MSLKQNFELMARYNRWMNEKIYEAAGSLSDQKVREDQGAFFKSILGTLNHILVGDTLWLKRFAEHPKRPASLDRVRSTSAPPSLDAILHDDLASLRIARRALDDAIVAWSEELEDSEFAVDLTYADSKGTRHDDNFGELVHHFFNHQTHHRGQVTTLLSQNGVDAGSTDLLKIIRE